MGKKRALGVGAGCKAGERYAGHSRFWVGKEEVVDSRLLRAGGGVCNWGGVLGGPSFSPSGLFYRQTGWRGGGAEGARGCKKVSR